MRKRGRSKLESLGRKTQVLWGSLWLFLLLFVLLWAELGLAKAWKLLALGGICYALLLLALNLWVIAMESRVRKRWDTLSSSEQDAELKRMLEETATEMGSLHVQAACCFRGTRAGAGLEKNLVLNLGEMDLLLGELYAQVEAFQPEQIPKFLWEHAKMEGWWEDDQEELIPVEDLRILQELLSIPSAEQSSGYARRKSQLKALIEEQLRFGQGLVIQSLPSH